MFDIHCHLLYGVDDGCKTISESLEMLKVAVSHGVTDICLTPHYALRRKYKAKKEELLEKFTSLQEAVIKEHIPVNLYLGNEIDEDTDMFDFISNHTCLTLNNTKYILLDFGMRKCDVDDIVYELIVRGFKPIIAHPERYAYVEGIDLMKHWKKTGALLQMNAGSLFGHSKEKKQAKLMIKHQLVDIIASDAHRNPKSYEYLVDTYKYISKKISKQYADIVTTFNPEVVKGES